MPGTPCTSRSTAARSSRSTCRSSRHTRPTSPSIRRRGSVSKGNTDERGSREYNIGLGERRAQTVRKALMLQGVAESQITTVSYGEERPAAEGHDEAAYAQNRRVVLVQVQ